MRKQSGLWQDNKTRPGSHLNPVLLQPWPELLPVAPETPSGPSLYGAWDGREDPALVPPLVAHGHLTSLAHIGH